MAFVVKSEHSEPTFSKLSDVPLIRERCKEKGFLKSGISFVEHIIPPGRFENFTLLSYSQNWRLNIGPKNIGNFEFLSEYCSHLDGSATDLPKLGIQLRDRTKGYVDVGVDEEKTHTWLKKPLGYTNVPDPF